MRTAFYGMVAFVACGCGAAENEFHSNGTFDRDAFVSTINPILGKRCANPSCHGQTMRPFAIYAPLRFRIDARRTFLDEPLTEKELDHNFWACVVLASEAERPEDALLVAKPLATVRYHGGGAIFDSANDADARRLITWIAEGLSREVQP